MGHSTLCPYSIIDVFCKGTPDRAQVSFSWSRVFRRNMNDCLGTELEARLRLAKFSPGPIPGPAARTNQRFAEHGVPKLQLGNEKKSFIPSCVHKGIFP